MLTCAQIVWVSHPNNWDSSFLRKTYLTEQECKNIIDKGSVCIKIDKRYDLPKREWDKYNCSISEHKWIGNVK